MRHKAPSPCRGLTCWTCSHRRALASGGKRSQAAVAPPTFILFTNSLTKLHFSYERFLENRLREEYGFIGAPIRIQIRGRAEQRGGDVRKTARERAPERRSPVRKGPGSTRTTHDRQKEASQSKKRAENKGAWDKSPSAFAKATADKARRGKAKGKPVSAKQKSRVAQPKLSKKSRAKQGPKRSGR